MQLTSVLLTLLSATSLVSALAEPALEVRGCCPPEKGGKRSLEAFELMKRDIESIGARCLCQKRDAVPQLEVRGCCPPEKGGKRDVEAFETMRRDLHSIGARCLCSKRDVQMEARGCCPPEQGGKRDVGVRRDFLRKREVLERNAIPCLCQ